MTENRPISSLFLLISALFMLSACSVADESESALITINTGLGNAHKFAAKAPAPSNVESITLTISGDNIKDIIKPVPADSGIITISVPAGKSRTFEVLARLNSSVKGAVKSYKGSTTRILKPGAHVSLDIEMKIYEASIVIPDMKNSRIVQIDNIDGLTADINASWKSLDGNSLGYDVFTPYDADFDFSGRIFIAAGNSGVIRIDDISGENRIEIPADSNIIRCLSVDKKNNFIYFADPSNVYKCGPNGEDSSVFIPAISGDSVYGISIDPYNNLLFVCGESNFQVFDTDTGNALCDFGNYLSVSLRAWDIYANSSGIYGAICSNNSGSIVQFAFNRDSSELSEVKSYLTSLYGPRSFLPVSGDGICFIDENSSQPEINRIIYLESIDGANRKEYGSTGSGVGEFLFFIFPQ